MKKKNNSEKIVLALLFVFLLAIRLYPAYTNEYLKGSDSWYHLERARSMLDGDFFYDSRNAGGAVSAYTPFFHLIIIPVHFFPDPVAAAKFFGPLLGFLGAVAFFMFARKIMGYKESLVATFVFGTAVEIVNTAMFLAPVNLAFIFMFLALFFALDDEKSGGKFYLSTLFASLLALMHPLTFIMFIIFALVFLDHKVLKFISIPITVFVLWIVFSAAIVAQTSIILSNPLPLERYFFGVSALAFAFAVIGIRKAQPKLSLLFALLTSYSLLVVFYPDRVFTYSVIAVALLAGMGFADLYHKISQHYRFILMIFLLISAIPVFDYGYAKTEMRGEDKSVLDWIKNNTEQDATIAASWQVSGAWMPYAAERKNILGAFQESVADYQERRRDLAVVFSSGDKEKIIETMRKYNATYIFVNKMEDDALYKGSIKRFSDMFTEVDGNDYAHLYKI
ncbi:MAG: hypothetical protein HY514_00525 [Candidatus Aenigmarchaeota archaeon]|nr:hypothetical protein [Candidatus Aenigmarchaeota archaeon]